MHYSDEATLFEWLRIIGRKVLECLFIAAWIILAWALDEYVVKRFPLEGTPHLIKREIEVMFDISTSYQLLRLLLFRGRKPPQHPPWWL
jgi:hypothetical protein